MPPDSVMIGASRLSHSDRSRSTFSMKAGFGARPNRPRLKLHGRPHRLEGIGGQLLRHQADLHARRAVVAHDVVAVGHDACPAVGGDDAADDADQRGLAGAVGTQQREDLALADLEVDALERLQARGVGLGQAAHRQDDVGRRRARRGCGHGCHAADGIGSAPAVPPARSTASTCGGSGQSSAAHSVRRQLAAFQSERPSTKATAMQALTSSGHRQRRELRQPIEGRRHLRQRERLFRYERTGGRQQGGAGAERALRLLGQAHAGDQRHHHRRRVADVGQAQAAARRPRRCQAALQHRVQQELGQRDAAVGLDEDAGQLQQVVALRRRERAQRRHRQVEQRQPPAGRQPRQWWRHSAPPGPRAPVPRRRTARRPGPPAPRDPDRAAWPAPATAPAAARTGPACRPSPAELRLQLCGKGQRARRRPIDACSTSAGAAPAGAAPATAPASGLSRATAASAGVTGA